MVNDTLRPLKAGRSRSMRCYDFIRVSSKAGTLLAKASSQATSFGQVERHPPSNRRSR